MTLHVFASGRSRLQGTRCASRLVVSAELLLQVWSEGLRVAPRMTFRASVHGVLVGNDWRRQHTRDKFAASVRDVDVHVHCTASGVEFFVR